MNFEFDDIEEGWPRLLKHVIRTGRFARPRGHETLEVCPVMFTLTDPSRAVLHSAARKLNHAFSAAEFCWVMAGDDEVDTLAFFNSKMRDFADQGAPGKMENVIHNARLFGAYGPPIVAQLPYVLESLRDPDSRQAVLTIWRPSPPKTKDVPCTVALQFLLRDGKLSMLTTMRSNDLFLGVPYDVPLFCRVLHYVASRLGVDVGAYHHVAGSLHVYERDYDALAPALGSRHVGVRPPELIIGKFADEDPKRVWAWVKDAVQHGYKTPTRLDWAPAGSTSFGAGWHVLTALMGEYVDRKLAKGGGV
jgi:thymidylate synthase